MARMLNWSGGRVLLTVTGLIARDAFAILHRNEIVQVRNSF